MFHSELVPGEFRVDAPVVCPGNEVEEGPY